MKDMYLMMILIPAVIIMNIIAFYVFIPGKYRQRINIISAVSKCKNSFIFEIFPYLLLVALIYILVKFQWSLISMFNIQQSYFLAEYILNIEGNTVRMFQTFVNPFLTYLSSFIYLIGFPFLLTFTFLALLVTRKVKALQEYAIAVALVYIFSFPFFVFVPVTVTGYILPDVVPILYNINPLIYDGLKALDPYLNRCFPSLHVALSFLAMLFILLKTDLKGFKPVAIFLAFSIQFTIFYLGIHWMIDLVGGILLALISFYMAIRIHDRITNKANIALCGETVDR